MSDDETFEATDSGAAGCKPIAVGQVKVGKYVLIKGFPCKVADYSTSKTGKHGSAKANYYGYDIFSGKKYEEMAPVSATRQEPEVLRLEFQVVGFDEHDANDDGAIVNLVDEAGEPNDSLRIPLTPEYKPLRDAIKDNLEGSGKEVYVNVLSAIGIFKVLPDQVNKVTA